ncbi:MAG TPA: universal stress protein [Methanocella sp.]|jgi:nucleotide-binding universal stress UspA family protein
MADQVKYSKIMVPTDGSNTAFLAGKHAVYLAKTLGASVLVLNVVESDLAFHAGLRYAEEVGQLEKSGVEATARIKALCDEAGVPAREILVKGSPAPGILEVAGDEQADLIVMGTVGMSAVERVLLGSVSEKVSRHAACPVLLVREK